MFWYFQFVESALSMKEINTRYSGIIRPYHGPGVVSATSKNEYQKRSWG